MQKRVIFPNKGLPYLLVLPQIVITLVFFIWPAGQALKQSVYREDPFGVRPPRFIGLDNFANVLGDPAYINSLWVTLIFSVAVVGVAMGLSLLLAVMADKVVRGAAVYKTLLIWPYAVAPAIAGLLRARQGVLRFDSVDMTSVRTPLTSDVAQLREEIRRVIIEELHEMMKG